MSSDQGMTVEQALAVFDEVRRLIRVGAYPEAYDAVEDNYAEALATLRAEIARLEKDAGRWRYVRDNVELSLPEPQMVHVMGTDIYTAHPCTGKEAEQAIDAAIDAAKGERHEP